MINVDNKLLFVWRVVFIYLFSAEANVKRERPFGTHALLKSRNKKIQQSRKTSKHKCFKWPTRLVRVLLHIIARSPHCPWHTVPLAIGMFGFWLTYVATGVSGERTPFQLIACDAQGGDPEHIESADVALAISLGQLPVVAQADPNSVLSFSWPFNMEVQDLYPVSTSTYTWPTGSTSEVPCYSLNKVVLIEREACPASFDNPIDPNYIKPCVKVRLTPAVIHRMLLEALNPPQVQDTSHTSSKHHAHTHIIINGTH